MQTLDAKTHFLKVVDDQSKSQLLEIVNSSAIRSAMIYAFSQLAEEGATADQLFGARRFRELLMNLPEPKPQPPTFPKKELQTLG